MAGDVVYGARDCVRPSAPPGRLINCARYGRHQRLCVNAIRVHYLPLLACFLSVCLGHHAECSSSFRCGTA